MRQQSTTTCRTCERTWSILEHAHCAECHSHFTTPRAFNVHINPLSRNGICEYPAAMRDKANRPLFSVITIDHTIVYELIDHRHDARS